MLVSGGMDSAVVLALARERGLECYALSVSYGQRHGSELAAAAALRAAQGAVAHKIVVVDLRSIGGSALTADIDVPESGGAGIPVTYVPARNTIMLSVALGWAEVLGAGEIHCGVNAVDYSGYPDCRPEFIAAFERAGHARHQGRRRGLAAARARAADAHVEGRHRARRHAPGRGFRAHRVLLPGRRAGPRLRPLRRLPAARGGLRGGGRAGSDAISARVGATFSRDALKSPPCGSLAQLVEQKTFNLLVPSSSLGRPTILFAFFSRR